MKKELAQLVPRLRVVRVGLDDRAELLLGVFRPPRRMASTASRKRRSWTESRLLCRNASSAERRDSSAQTRRSWAIPKR